MPRDCAWPRSRSSKVIADSWPSSRYNLRQRILSIPEFPGDPCQVLWLISFSMFACPCARLAALNLILRPNCYTGVKNPCAILIRLTRRRGLLAVGAPGGADSPRRIREFGRPPQAQAAPGMAAAEEILVPMDDSILAGPANPAIAFRGSSDLASACGLRLSRRHERSQAEACSHETAPHSFQFRRPLAQARDSREAFPWCCPRA